MEDQANTTLVGAFVLVLGTVLVAGMLWLASGLGRRQAMDDYQALIGESVAGLSVDAPVKYLGVDVGKVSGIEIDTEDTARVRLRFQVRHGTPIKQDSVAVLKTQGLTGIAYVELSGGSAASPPLLAGVGGAVPMIPFKLSLGARLESVVTSTLANVDRVSNSVNAVFDADNRAALKSTLADLAAVARSLAAQQGALRTAMAGAARGGEKLGPTLDRIASSAQAVERMADVAGAASQRAGRAADAAASSVQQAGSETLPEIQRLLAELQLLSASLRRLSEQTAASPSSLLVGRPLPVPGPGESAPP